MDHRQLTRRQFIRDSAAAAAAVAAGLSAADGSPAGAAQDDARKTRSYNEQMEYRRLGKTGLWVSAVCLGGHWKRIDKVIGQAKGEGGQAAFDRNRHDVVSRCLDVGINYIDACMGPEVIAYAKALKGRRDSVYLGYSWSDKEPRQEDWRTTARLLQGLDEGLKEAALEYVDVWRVTMHERGSRHSDAEAEQMVAALVKARQQGKCRFGGFSSHDRPWIRKMIEKFPEVQVVCTPYTADTKELPEDSLFDAVRKADVGIFGIKPFASNSLFKGDGSPDSPQAAEDDRRARLAIRYILANPAITAPIPGLITAHQVDNVAEAVKERRKLDRAEKAELRQATQEMWAKLPEDYQWLKEWKHV
jgi:aryl-alcohol dehydrogenase-like predicted oxidoreductase